MRQASNSIEMDGPLHSVMPDVLPGLATLFGGWISCAARCPPGRCGQGRPAHLPLDAMPQRPAVRAEESGGEGRERWEEGRGGEKNPGDGGLTRRRRKENDDN